METAKSASNNISTAFYKETTVKGKLEPVLIYVPVEKDLEPTEKNLFPNFKSHAFTFGFAKRLEFKDVQLFGRDEVV